MNIVDVNHVVKAYADKVAVNDLSFSVGQGEIFGLIGPNGAGKTTTIKMMMDIIKPDSGDVTILGEKLNDNTKNKTGYLPEERGLYKKLKVIDTIVYLASLKGLDKKSAIEKANALLNRMGMLASARKNTDELSKGMGQIIQFIVTIIHEPQLIILDEPFASLDPVNTELMKGMLSDLKSRGKAIILSTHQMNQVEELCDRILMVNKGRAILYGDLREIKSGYQSNSVLVDVKGELGNMPGVAEKYIRKGYTELILDGKTTPQQLLESLVNRGLIINRFEVATPPLNQIFIDIVGKRHE